MIRPRVPCCNGLSHKLQGTPNLSKQRRSKMYSSISITLIAIVAFQAASLTALGQQADLEQASAAPSPGAAGAESNSAALVDAASAMASPEDLLAAESSDGAEHKAFTSAQVLRQEQSAASVAPSVFAGQQPVFHHQPPHQQQQGAQHHHQQVAPAQVSAQQQQQQQHAMPPHMQAPRFAQPQASMHHPHAKPAPQHMNPFMAAALAGNYGPAQQQMAAAALHAQQQAHLMHHPQGPAAAHPAPQQVHHHGAIAPPAGQPMGVAHGPPQAQQFFNGPQAQQQQQAAAAPLAVQESSIRHNVVPAPALESNAIEADGPAGQQQQQQQPAGAAAAQSTQLVAASSAQHPVIASASASSPIGSSSPQDDWPLNSPDIPKIVSLEVKCEKNLMKVSVEFDKIFNGVIFSKGHYSQNQCVHVTPNSNKQQAYFDISINSCGTQGNTQNGLYGMGQNTGSGTFFENTIVIQYDPNVQEVYDHARKLRCTWHDQYEKAVTFRPFPVDMLDIVRADFAGDNVGCWMQIQVGKGPWASEVAGIVKIGQTMTMVLAIKDEENKFDMLVRNCFAHDGKRGPIELVDKSGCITRPKLMSRFTKIKNFGSSATVLSYAHFQAFKFPDSMEVHFQCTIQICRHQCPEQCAAGPGAPASASSEAYSESTISGTFNIHSGSQTAPGSSEHSGHLRKFGSAALSRARRSAGAEQHARWSNGSHHQPQHTHHKQQLTQSVGLNRVIQVVSTGDLAFAIKDNKFPEASAQHGGRLVDANDEQASSLASRLDLMGNQICMSSYNFVLALVMLVLILLCSCMLAISLYIRQRSLLAQGHHKLRNVSSSPAHLMNKHLIHTPSPQTTASTPKTPTSSQTASSNHYMHTNVPTQSPQMYYAERR